MPDAMQRIKQLAAIAAVAMCLGQTRAAFALGLGELHLRSALNQPLDARIELTSITPDERDALSVRVAPPELFQRFGIERSPLIDGLSVDRVGSDLTERQMLHLTSRRPVREPFVNVLIEAETSGGRTLRAYTLLLDPPGQARSGGTDTSGNAPASSRPAQTAERMGHDNTYGPVAAGETLFGLAERLRPDGMSVDQMQVALFRANPQAFDGGMETLLRGSTLTVPGSQTVAAIDPVAADKQVRAQLQRSAVEARPEPASTTPPEPAGETPPPEARPRQVDAPERNEPVATDTVVKDGPTQGILSGSDVFGRMALPGAAARVGNNPPVALDDGSRMTAVESTGETASSENGVAATGLKALEGSVPATSSAGPSMPVRPGPDAVAHDAVTQAGTKAGVGASPVAGESIPQQDVAAADETGWLSPRNILLLLLLSALVLMLAFWRRSREYRSVPLDAVDDDKRAPPASAEQDAGAVASVPVTRETAAPTPEARVRQAEREVEADDFHRARTTLEEGLANDPHHSALQDTLLELDYLMGDAVLFDRDIQRFEVERQGGGLRWARLAAMGRLLSPDDPRFMFDRYAAQAQESPAEPAGTDDPDFGETQLPSASADSRDERPESEMPSAVLHAEHEDALEVLFDAGETPERGGAGYREPGPGGSEDTTTDEIPPAAMDGPDDDTFRLDTAGTDLGAYDWEDTEIPAATEREHDNSDEAGMAFELDTSDAPDSARGAIGDTPAPIDTGEFDLDDPGPTPVDETVDEHPATIRLDLARMYMDMKDESAARPLLEEVLETGDASHRERAQTLLASLG